jgi:nucleoid-associated protein YgaU
LNRPLLIGAGSLAAVIVVVLAVSRNRDGGNSTPPPPSPVAGTAQSTPAASNPGPPQLAAAPPSQQNLPAQPLPSFDVVRVNPQGETVIAGRAAPNAEVTVFDGETAIGKTMADTRGEFVVIPDKTLQPGNRSLSLSERIPGKDEAVRSSADVLVAVPEAKHDLAGTPSDSGNSTLALLVPHAGDGAARPLQVPTTSAPASGPAGAESKQGLTLDIIEYDDKGHISLAGRADPGAGINLYLSGRFIGHAQAGDDGKWSIKPQSDVASGLYQLRIDQVHNDGKVVARLALPFQRAEPTELAQGQSFTVQPGNSLWRIARRSYGEGTRFAVIYAANRDRIGDPDLIYAGQVFKLPSKN